MADNKAQDDTVGLACLGSAARDCGARSAGVIDSRLPRKKDTACWISNLLSPISGPMTRHGRRAEISADERITRCTPTAGPTPRTQDWGPRWMPATASFRVAMPPGMHLFLQSCLPSGRGLCPAYCRLPVGSSKTPHSATEIQHRFDSLVICVTQTSNEPEAVWPRRLVPWYAWFLCSWPPAIFTGFVCVDGFRRSSKPPLQPGRRMLCLLFLGTGSRPT